MTRHDRMALAADLRGLPFRKKTYRQYSPEWQHDHCAACFVKFAEDDSEAGTLHEGYATTGEYFRGEDYDWICPACFDELRDEMAWEVVK